MGKFDRVLLASDFDNTLVCTQEALDNGTFQQFHDTYVHKLDTRI